MCRAGFWSRQMLRRVGSSAWSFNCFLPNVTCFPSAGWLIIHFCLQLSPYPFPPPLASICCRFNCIVLKCFQGVCGRRRVWYCDERRVVFEFRDKHHFTGLIIYWLSRRSFTTVDFLQKCWISHAGTKGRIRSDCKQCRVNTTWGQTTTRPETFEKEFRFVSVTLFLCLGVEKFRWPPLQSHSRFRMTSCPVSTSMKLARSGPHKDDKPWNFPSRGFVMWTRPDMKKTGPISFLVAFKEEILHKIWDNQFKSVLKFLKKSHFVGNAYPLPPYFLVIYIFERTSGKKKWSYDSYLIQETWYLRI